MGWWTAGLWLLLGAPAVADEAQWPPDLSFTEHFQLRYWVVDDRLPAFPERPVFNYVEQVNRLTAQGVSGQHNLFVQVDQVALFANRYVLDGQEHKERDLLSPELPGFFPGESYANLAKLRYRRQTSAHTLDLGDTYAGFGRGIALNLNRNVDMDVDTSIQGVRSVHRIGSWELTGLAGQLNRQIVFQDNPNVRLLGPRRHAVGGLRVERFGLGAFDLGAHAVAYDFVLAPGLGPAVQELSTGPDVVVGGATVEAHGVLGLDLFVEADWFHYASPVLFAGGQPEPGHALYASAAAYLGATSWLFEGKRYLNVQRTNAVVGAEFYEVVVPPTLEYERVITEDSAAALGSNDIWGARLRMDAAVVPGSLVPYLSMAVFRDLDVGPLHFNVVPETILHPVAGVEAFGEHVQVMANLGFRADIRDGGGEHGADRLLHADLDLRFPLPGGFHADLALGAERFLWGVNPFQQEDYVEVDSSLTLQRGPKLALVWYTDYSSNPLVDSRGNLSEHLYGALEIQARPSNRTQIKAFYGAYKAGIRCAGGQCRMMPGFQGARMSVATAF